MVEKKVKILWIIWIISRSSLILAKSWVPCHVLPSLVRDYRFRRTSYVVVFAWFYHFVPSLSVIATPWNKSLADFDETVGLREIVLFCDCLWNPLNKKFKNIENNVTSRPIVQSTRFLDDSPRGKCFRSSIFCFLLLFLPTIDYIFFFIL